jgi:hypothetical protein
MLFCRLLQGRYGIDISFPPSHRVLTWPAASLIASKYLFPCRRLWVYSLATGPRLATGLGQQQFPIEALTGSATGWLVRRYVFRTNRQKAGR